MRFMTLWYYIIFYAHQKYLVKIKKKIFQFCLVWIFAINVNLLLCKPCIQRVLFTSLFRFTRFCIIETQNAAAVMFVPTRRVPVSGFRMSSSTNQSSVSVASDQSQERKWSTRPRSMMVIAHQCTVGKNIRNGSFCYSDWSVKTNLICHWLILWAKK